MKFTKIQPESIGFILFCGSLAALAGLSTDISLPAVSVISDSLNVHPADIALTITVFLAGLSLGPLVYGPLSDRYGRRPLLIVGCALFTIAGLGCTFASNLEALLFFRFLQGVGAGAGASLTLSIVRDVCEGARARTLLSYLAIVRVLGPMIAPTIGAIILKFSHWRVIFAFPTACGLLFIFLLFFKFEETAPRFKKAGLYETVPLLKSYKIVLSNPAYLGYTLITALSFGGQFSYVTGSSLVFIQTLGVSPQVFGGIFALSAFGVIVAAFVNSRMAIRAISGSKLLLRSLTGSIIIMASLLTLTLTDLVTPWTLTPLLVLSSFCNGIIGPNAQQGALHPLPHVVGTAAAWLSAITMLVGAIAGGIVSHLYPTYGILAMTGTMAAFFGASFLVYLGMRHMKMMQD